MDSNETPARPADNAEELFAKVSAAEAAADHLSDPESSVGAALALYERCTGIMIEATAVDLTTEQRTDLDARMHRLNSGLQQQAMTEFLD